MGVWLFIKLNVDDEIGWLGGKLLLIYKFRNYCVDCGN